MERTRDVELDLWAEPNYESVAEYVSDEQRRKTLRFNLVVYSAIALFLGAFWFEVLRLVI
jgi:hypothetical protein